MRKFIGSSIAALILIASWCPAWAACDPETLSGCIMPGGVISSRGPAPGEQFSSIDRGLFVYSNTDMTVAGAMPLEVTRVYRSEDRNNIRGAFVTRDLGLAPGSVTIFSSTPPTRWPANRHTAQRE